MFKSIVWSSTIDYPNQVSTVLFVGTCNWRCEYCYNRNLINNKSIDFDTEILPRLLDRKDFINHIVISGGECTCYNELENVIDKLIDNGFIIGIHTNGSNPKMLKKILPKISFVGMDIKCIDKHIDDFNTSSNMPYLHECGESIFALIESNKEYEFRTTLYPKYFNSIKEIQLIAVYLKNLGARKYVLQEYMNDFDKTLPHPYSKDYILKIVKECNKIIPTELKGYIE